MTRYQYSVKVQENMAQAVGRNLSISTKHSIEICKFVRGKGIEKAKDMLGAVKKKKRAVPFTRFNRDVGHKTKIGPGRYPVNACTKILELIESAEANAQFKGLSTSTMVVKHISAQKGAKTMKWGRRGRQAKNTTIEVVLEEGTGTEEKSPAKKSQSKVTKEKKEKPKADKKATVKAEIKEETKAEVKKEETPETKNAGKPAETENTEKAAEPQEVKKPEPKEKKVEKK